MAEREARRKLVAFEDRTRPEQRIFGVYLIKAVGTDHAEIYTGAYPTARRLARRHTQYGDVELTFLESQDTPAID